VLAEQLCASTFGEVKPLLAPVIPLRE